MWPPTNLEVLARTTFAEHHDSVVTILTKERESPTKLSAIGSGFIIRSSGSRCLVMACRHVFRHFDPAKHTMHARLSGQHLELDAEVMRLDDARDLMLIRVVGMPRAYPALEFCDCSNVPDRGDVVLLAFFSTYALVFLDPGVLPGNISAPPQETNGVVHHTCVGTSGCFGGPLIFDGRVIGVYNGIKSRTGFSASAETVNAAMKDWLHIPPGVTKTTGEMVQSLLI
ncbi:hypothetical protein SEVIR_9G272400v4 [Setaria viridis]|uniref:Uncharacterized protein n=1 Tax=Setaria viridis TaxID=4556 RepID=A0A4U6T0E3_SETVI|nr:uncharacterized protein LOC117837173 [Setaria viridis]TKV94114.1 hypothetical protein SEVIR_9G272400v2 [Setaria viridis]